MKQLNLRKSKQIAIDISKKITPISRRDFFLVHSEKVGKVAKMIAQKIWLNNDVFEIAWWIHDIGYLKNIENHADFAIPILEELWYEINEILRDCILNHGNGKNPKTNEWKIFQIADKFSIFDQDIIKIMLKHGTFPLKNEDVNFLKMMSGNAFKLLENYTK